MSVSPDPSDDETEVVVREKTNPKRIREEQPEILVDDDVFVDGNGDLETETMAMMIEFTRVYRLFFLSINRIKTPDDKRAFALRVANRAYGFYHLVDSLFPSPLNKQM